VSKKRWIALSEESVWRSNYFYAQEEKGIKTKACAMTNYVLLFAILSHVNIKLDVSESIYIFCLFDNHGLHGIFQLFEL